MYNKMRENKKENIDENWAVSLELISTKDAVGFYKKKGFEERPCE